MLDRLDVQSVSAGGEHVAILVGPNGAGKSNFLKKLAVEIGGQRDLAVICNTPYDRFSGMQGIKRISASRGGDSPKSVVKQAVARTIDAPNSRFFQIGRILDYCGYRPRFGFKVEDPREPGFMDHSDELAGLDQLDYDASVGFLRRYNPGETLWADQSSSALAFSFSREFAAVLRCEEQLRTLRLLRDVQVYLERHDGRVIELLHASSGELALISSLIFLITSVENESVILIDEPENSLHPTWQREYVDKVLNACEYRNVAFVIATHAPLIVTGALASFPDLVSVFQIHEGEPSRLDLTDASGSASGIEEILWRAFDVVTPANHYVSEQLAGVVTKLEDGEIAREAALAIVDKMDSRSFDDKQRDFFGAVRELIDKVDTERGGGDRGDG